MAPPSHNQATPPQPAVGSDPQRTRVRTAVLAATSGAIGVAAWVALEQVLPAVPAPLRFLVTWLLFTWGPGAALGAGLTRRLPPLDRVIVVLGFGSVATPIVVDVMGRWQGLAAFPYVACALAGIGVALWRPSSARPAARTAWVDAAACALLVLLASGLGAIVFAHRLMPVDGGLTLHGNYDSFDLSFYAVWAAEAAHTVPPTAAYYVGHGLNAAYYPQFVLAMVHRFADVPLLPIYFRYAWPAALSLGALCAFALTRSIASSGTALLAVVLILTGGDFSYLAAWWLPHANGQWDYLLWPTNFLSPTMETLYFNTWAQTLPVFFTAFYAIVQALRTRGRGWTVMSGLLVASLFQFKVFAFAVLIAGLCAAALFSYRDRAACRTLAAITGLGILLALPFLYGIATLHEDRRTRLLIDFFLLPRRMLLKLDLTDTFWNLAGRLAPVEGLRRPLFLLLATTLFVAGGLGIRWLALPAVWRALLGRMGADAAAWRVLAWTAVAGVAIPFVLVTDPYVDTLQFYQTGLYVLWIFTATAVVSFASVHRQVGGIAIALAIAVALPSSIHFLRMKWTDAERPPIAGLTRAELRIAAYLQTTDPEATVVLHDEPLSPSLVAVVSGRRVVLAWAHPYYAVNSAGRIREVDGFFSSAGTDGRAALDVLHRYHVTHVIVHEARDRLHPAVLAALQAIIRTPVVTLYAVLPAAGF